MNNAAIKLITEDTSFESKQMTKVEIEPGRFASKAKVHAYDKRIHEEPQPENGIRRPTLQVKIGGAIPHASRVISNDSSKPPYDGESKLGVQNCGCLVQISVLR